MSEIHAMFHVNVRISKQERPTLFFEDANGNDVLVWS